MAPFRVLVSSAGRRVELVECFRRAAADLGRGIEILASDLDPDMSAACRMADRRFAVPRCDDPRFTDAVEKIVRDNGVDLVVPTIDTELIAMADLAERLAGTGTRVQVGSREAVAVARDKLETVRVLGGAGIPVPLTADWETVSARPAAHPWPLFMKPKGGSASRGLARLDGPADLPASVPEPMILQEFLSGPEMTVNVFVDRSGTLRTAITHRRLRIRAGEVEKGRTERRDDTAAIARAIHRALPGLTGVFCFQAIADPERGTKVIEINARFGGGYPLADRAGATFARWLLEEVTGLPSTANDDWREGVLMLRYDAAVFVE
ncbi:ATP-grasp domain-containing protein [Prosthecomicrobium sp. N25]|uniref:ATP-grasp domain-containing protein n=1 Tax=Prosthecomicrobium sp. N25 TaxID=3129254 RepID=UPI0030773966